MLSLDVDFLFTNVALEDVLGFLQRKLALEDPCLPLPMAAFLDLVRLCVDSNYFSFNGHYYELGLLKLVLTYQIWYFWVSQVHSVRVSGKC